MPFILGTIEIGRVLLSGWNNIMTENGGVRGCSMLGHALPRQTMLYGWINPQFVPSVDVGLSCLLKTQSNATDLRIYIDVGDLL